MGCDVSCGTRIWVNYHGDYTVGMYCHTFGGQAFKVLNLQCSVCAREGIPRMRDPWAAVG